MNPPDRSEVDDIFSGGDLTTLVDLQKFLADELAQSSDGSVDLSRAFMPLTDGLGIAGVPKAAGSLKATYSRTEQRREEEAEEELLAEEEYDAEDLLAPETATAAMAQELAPPPVPAATLVRRFLAGFVDQCFVLTAFLLALAITSNAMAKGSGDFGARFMREFSNPDFLRSAGFEFFGIWLLYLTFSLGVLEMTFGMWVWGLRVTFGESGRFWKKVARIAMSLFFYPFVAPLVMLLFNKEGDHLIDLVTQSRVYRT